MKININELVQIGNLCEKFSNRVVGARLAYKLAKLSKAISEDINFYQEKYIEYLDKFGERDDNGDFISNGTWTWDGDNTATLVDEDGNEVKATHGNDYKNEDDENRTNYLLIDGEKYWKVKSEN